MRITKAMEQEAITNHRLLVDEIKLLIETSDHFAIKCLLKLYSLQTSDEQSRGNTVYENDVGFSGCDAQILSSFAEQVQRWSPETSSYNSPLSPRQLALTKKKLPKYAKQLFFYLEPEE